MPSIPERRMCARLARRRRTLPASGLALASFVVALALGCGDDDDRDEAEPSATRDAGDGSAHEGGGHANVDAQVQVVDGGRDAAVAVVPPPSPCEGRGLALLRVEAWPGGGLQLAIAALHPDGSARDLGDALPRLLRANGEAVPWVLGAEAQSAGLTALLFVPSADPDEHARRIETAAELAKALPAAERIALYVLRSGVPLAAELSERRDHLLARLAALKAEQSDEPQGPALDRVGTALRNVMAAWGPIARNVIVVGVPLDEDGVEPGAGIRLRDGTLQASLAVPAKATGEDATPAAAARALAALIADQRAELALLGACGPFTFDEPLQLELDGAHCELRVPPPQLEWQSASCDAERAAADAYPFAESIALDLDEEQLALHDAYAEAKNEADFAVQLRIGDSDPIDATAHFRGQTSLDCARKNYSLNLQGSRARRFAPGFAADELYLISMCKETFYFSQVWASKMMRALGLFPLDQRYVRLQVAGRDLGVYLLLEKPEDTLRADHLALAAVVRRRLEADRKAPDVKFPDDAAGAERALGEYRGVAALIDSVAPEQLAADLAARVDLDGYLDWLALNTYLECGDSADEAFFYASSEHTPDGAEQWYFRQHGWDADDLFHRCHHDGKFAIVDPAGLLYCAESDLDRSLIAAPEIHARYVDALDRMIGTTLPPARLLELLAETRDELVAHMQDEAACSAMVELIASYPDATSCEQMRAVVDDGVTLFAGFVQDRASTLQAQIAAHRGAP